MVCVLFRVQPSTSSPELMLSRHSLKRERSLSPSTLSVDSEDQSDSSFGFDTPRPPASKSAKCSKGTTKWDDFTFPAPPGLKKDADEIADNIRKQIIRDVYTCMRAKCGDEKISRNDFIIVAKKVCKRIPQLKDKKAVGLKVDCSDFAYWVSATNTASSDFDFMIENYLVMVRVIFFMKNTVQRGKVQ